jgi:predicted phosphodiesterase
MNQNRRHFFKKTASVITMASVVPMMPMGHEFLFDSSDPDSGHIFLTKPYLQNPTLDAVTIMWIVNLASYSYVEYGDSENLGQIARETNDGLVVAYNRMNKITLQNLKPETTYYYRVVSKEISKFDPYKLVYGETIYSEVYSFSTPSENKEKVSMLIMNDIHERPGSIPQLMRLANEKTTDFVFFNGDIFNYQKDEKQIIDHMLAPCCEEFASNIPFYFVRGNHETRGKFARNIHYYFSNPTGKQYYDFVYGSVHFTVLDTGEDKPDDTDVYADIVDFDSYRAEQLAWFKKVALSQEYKNAKFRVVLMHIPIYYSGDWHGTMHLRELFSSVFNQEEIDMCISGHTHKYGIHETTKEEHNYPIIIGGGPKKGSRTIIDLKADTKVLNIYMLADDGKEVGSYR